MAKYETIHEANGLKYEIVDTGEVGLFGEPIIKACTFGIEMVPKPVRRTLGMFRTRAEARARLDQEIAAYSMASATHIALAEAEREIERLRAALKPFADEVDMLGIQGCAPPPERLLMFASDGGGTFLGIQVSTLYAAHAAFQQLQGQEK